jgi:FAD/FMN-containing dehydrogenase
MPLMLFSVGIGGHASHGGFGYTSRMWGITLDTILSMEVVLADGSITCVSKTENPDLFWVSSPLYGLIRFANLPRLCVVPAVPLA